MLRAAPTLRALAWPVFVCGLASCATLGSPFPDRPIVWVDPDRQLFEGPPAVLYTPPYWDAIDHTLFRPLAEVWRFEREREAVNVNALDEVPSSSWFHDRVARLRPADIERGACGDRPVPPTPWAVVERKTEGTRPGFLIRADDGVRYFVRTDETLRERGSAADAIATRILWAIGYDTPCNQVAFVRPEDLRLAGEPGDEGAPTQEDLDLVLQRANRMEDGRVRLSSSRFIDGQPLGGWRFWGTRPDDPNDVVPHEHRRDVRGMVVLSAWLNRIDSRSENNHDTWVEVEPGRGYVRHYVLDASDSFGMVWPESYQMAQRFGHSHYLDLQHLLEDLLSLGLLDRPYPVPASDRGLAAHVFGYYDVERFDPERWRNGYPNPAFERATERDRAWMARRIARLDQEDLEAAVRSGHFSRPLYADELVRILMGRRARILERYLTRLSPLASPRIVGGRLCLEDLAVVGGIRRAAHREYPVHVQRGWPPVSHAHGVGDAREDGVCVTLPVEPASGYWVVDLTATTGTERTGPARVHLVRGGAGHRVVGLERPEPR